jgi:hypothetical protein
MDTKTVSSIIDKRIVEGEATTQPTRRCCRLSIDLLTIPAMKYNSKDAVRTKKCARWAFAAILVSAAMVPFALHSMLIASDEAPKEMAQVAEIEPRRLAEVLDHHRMNPLDQGESIQECLHVCLLHRSFLTHYLTVVSSLSISLQPS